MRWARHVARIGERCAYRVLVGKSEGKRPLARVRCRWEENYDGSSGSGVEGGHKLYGAGSGWGQMAGCCECGNEPPGSIECGEFLD